MNDTNKNNGDEAKTPSANDLIRIIMICCMFSDFPKKEIWMVRVWCLLSDRGQRAAASGDDV